MHGFHCGRYMGTDAIQQLYAVKKRAMSKGAGSIDQRMYQSTASGTGIRAQPAINDDRKYQSASGMPNGAPADFTNGAGYLNADPRMYSSGMQPQHQRPSQNIYTSTGGQSQNAPTGLQEPAPLSYAPTTPCPLLTLRFALTGRRLQYDWRSSRPLLLERRTRRRSRRGDLRELSRIAGSPEGVAGPLKLRGRRTAARPVWELSGRRVPEPTPFRSRQSTIPSLLHHPGASESESNDPLRCLVFGGAAQSSACCGCGGLWSFLCHAKDGDRWRSRGIVQGDLSFGCLCLESRDSPPVTQLEHLHC